MLSHITRLRIFNTLRHWRFGLPSALGLEIATACNRACSYCPQSIGKFRKEQGDLFVTDEVWQAFISRLVEFRWRGMVGLHRYSEPTRHPKFAAFVEELANLGALPFLFTNGDYPEVLDEALAKGLFRALVTQHDPVKPGWFDGVLKLQRKYGPKRVRIRRLAELGNHAGYMPNIPVPPLTFCDDKNSGLGFNIKGEPFFCCEDPDLHTSLRHLGDLFTKSIHDIWYEPNYAKMRRDLRRGKPTLPICKGCFQTHD